MWQAGVSALIAGFHGHVCLFAKNLETGVSFGVLEDEKVRTASTIKLPVMVRVFRDVEAGRLRWDDTLILQEEDVVSGSGVLQEMSPGMRFPVRDLVHLMIVVSDNTATNLLLDRVTTDAVNDEMDSLGLSATRIMRKVMGGPHPPSGWSKAGKLPENQRFGLGSSTAKEMVTLLERIDRGEIVSPAASKEMLAILKRQQDEGGIRRKLRGVDVANKSGALDRLRSDVGIVYSKAGPIALAITVDEMAETDYSPDNPGLKLIADLTLLLVEGLKS